jgi:hypothetical protein
MAWLKLDEQATEQTMTTIMVKQKKPQNKNRESTM